MRTQKYVESTSTPDQLSTSTLGSTSTLVTEKYVDTYCICLSNYITPNKGRRRRWSWNRAGGTLCSNVGCCIMRSSIRLLLKLQTNLLHNRAVALIMVGDMGSSVETEETFTFVVQLSLCHQFIWYPNGFIAKLL
jgi:hypothetical protein